jgi:DNA-binding transcriptional LysR family regulator
MEFNLRSVDLNLLPIFEATYEERSLSKAAQRLAMTQPAMSRAMSRLRHVFKDDLFIRHSKGVSPTPAADDLYERLRGALGCVREAVVDSRGFDPASSTRRFRVAIPHPLGPLIGLRVRERLAAAAPNVTVEFNTRSLPVDLGRQLRDGTVDAAIGWGGRREPHLRSAKLFDERLVAMARIGHPLEGRALPLKSLATQGFVMLNPRSDATVEMEGIQQWKRLGIRPALEVSELLEVLLVVSSSDLLGIFPESLAGIARKFFDVKALTVKQGTKVFPVRLIWHERRESDRAHLFLRQHLADGAAIAQES